MPPPSTSPASTSCSIRLLEPRCAAAWTPVITLCPQHFEAPGTAAVDDFGLPLGSRQRSAIRTIETGRNLVVEVLLHVKRGSGRGAQSQRRAQRCRSCQHGVSRLRRGPRGEPPFRTWLLGATCTVGRARVKRKVSGRGVGERCHAWRRSAEAEGVAILDQGKIPHPNAVRGRPSGTPFWLDSVPPPRHAPPRWRGRCAPGHPHGVTA
jgi:hypothetical protein